MNLQQMIGMYIEEGLTREFASARVCQDIVLKAISDGPLNRNVTIKGGVVMRSLTDDNRRATRDIDLDFIHYSLADESIQAFVRKLNCIPDIKIEIAGDIEELKHQDYHGKSITIRITDQDNVSIQSKMDIGVHKYMELEQDEYCFDVCMDDNGVSLLKNSMEQAFVEKLRALLIFGQNDRRYKDIYDMYYLKDRVNKDRLHKYIKLLIFDDEGMRENTIEDIMRRVQKALGDKQFKKRISDSRQRWFDESIDDIADAIILFVKGLA